MIGGLNSHTNDLQMHLSDAERALDGVLREAMGVKIFDAHVRKAFEKAISALTELDHAVGDALSIEHVRQAG